MSKFTTQNQSLCYKTTPIFTAITHAVTTEICNAIFQFLTAVLRRLKHLGTDKDYFPSDAANKTHHIQPNIRQLFWYNGHTYFVDCPNEGYT